MRHFLLVSDKPIDLKYEAHWKIQKETKSIDVEGHIISLYCILITSLNEISTEARELVLKEARSKAQTYKGTSTKVSELMVYLRLEKEV